MVESKNFTSKAIPKKIVQDIVSKASDRLNLAKQNSDESDNEDAFLKQAQSREEIRNA
jgi:hypothetical protein